MEDYNEESILSWWSKLSYGDKIKYIKLYNSSGGQTDLKNINKNTIIEIHYRYKFKY